MQKGLGAYPFTAGTDGSLSGAVKNLLGNYPNANWNNGLHYFNTALVFYRRSDWQNAGISVTSAFAVSGVPVQLWQAQRAKWTQAQALSYLQVWKAAYSSWLARRSTVSR